MKTFVHALRFFLVSFTIASLVFISICIIASLDISENQNGFSVDFEKYSFTLFGTKYNLNSKVSNTLDSVLDFNSIFVGKSTNETIVSALTFVPQLCVDLLQCTMGALSGFISAGT